MTQPQAKPGLADFGRHLALTALLAVPALAVVVALVPAGPLVGTIALAGIGLLALLIGLSF